MRSTIRVLGGLAIAAVLALAGCGGGGPAAGGIPITTDSEEARTEFLEGRALAEKLRLTDARPHFRRAVQLDPGFASAHLGLATTAATASGFFAALADARSHAAAASDGERLLIEATAAGVNGEPGRQKELLDELVLAYPDSKRAWVALGGWHYGRQEWPEAIAAYRRAVDLDPEFPPPYNQLGYALRFIGDLDGAEEAFRTYVELIPDEPNPYDSLAELLMERGRHEESIATYRRALEHDPQFVASYIGIANNRIVTGAFEEARATLAELESIARDDGERRQAHTWKAMSHLHEGDHDAALAELRLRLGIAEAADDRVAMSADLDLIGDILLDAGRVDQAEQRFAESLTIMQLSGATDEVKGAAERNALYDDGRVALARDDVAAAASISDEYLRRAEEHGVRFELWQAHELAGMVALAEDDPDAALRHLEQANPQDPRAMLWKAKAMAAAGDGEAARELAARVAQLNRLSQTWAFVRTEAEELATPG